MTDQQQRCQHAHLRKEYLGGMGTGDYECIDCGKVGYGRDWPKKQREASTSKEQGNTKELN